MLNVICKQNITCFFDLWWLHVIRTYQDLTCTWDEGHYSGFFVLSIRLSPNLVISTSTFILLTLSRSGLVRGSAGWSLCGVPHWWSQVGPHFLFHWWKPGGFPGGSDGEKSTCSVGDLVLIPGLGRSPGGGHGNPLQCSCLESPMDRGAWRATVEPMGSQRIGHDWVPRHSTVLARVAVMEDVMGWRFRRSHVHDWSPGTQLGPWTRAQLCASPWWWCQYS